MRQQGRLYGKLYNEYGEIIAEGRCELDEAGSRVSMWPTQEKGLFERERGLMSLVLEGGRSFLISERRLRLKICPTEGPRSFIYRMQVEPSPAEEPSPPSVAGGFGASALESVPEHLRRADLPEEQAAPSGGLSTAP